jgi:hypothetical protein
MSEVGDKLREMRRELLSLEEKCYYSQGGQGRFVFVNTVYHVRLAVEQSLTKLGEGVF